MGSASGFHPVETAGPALLRSLLLAQAHLTPAGPVPLGTKRVPDPRPVREGLIWPDDVPWFPADRFLGYLWGYQDAVWLSLIHARRPARMRNVIRLIDGILERGRACYAPNPVPDARDMLLRLDFVPQPDPIFGADLLVKPVRRASQGRFEPDAASPPL